MYSIMNVLVKPNVGYYRTSKHRHFLVSHKSSKLIPADNWKVPGNLLSFDPHANVFSSANDNDFLVGQYLANVFCYSLD